MSLVLAPRSASTTSAVSSALEHLLLGDLRQVLEERSGPETSRWLMVLLDRLLANRPRTLAPFLPAPSRTLPWDLTGESAQHQRMSLFMKLQRLRDRVAHRAPYALLANEIRCDLREWMDAEPA